MTDKGTGYKSGLVFVGGKWARLTTALFFYFMGTCIFFQIFLFSCCYGIFFSGIIAENYCTDSTKERWQMPWKVKESGEFEVDGAGNPIFVLDSGEEKSVDYPAMASALTKANREAAERKEKLRANEEVLKKIEGIEDLPAFLEKAKKDAEAVAAFDDKQKSAEESARARVEAAVGPLNQKIKELETSYADALARYHRTLIDAEFGTSKYVNSELVSPVMAKDLFGKHFSVNEQGAIVATDTDGNIVYNEKGPADFDSALRTLVASSPYKDYVLRGNPASGSGAKTGNAGSHTDWSKLPPAERLAKAREAGYK